MSNYIELKIVNIQINQGLQLNIYVESFYS